MGEEAFRGSHLLDARSLFERVALDGRSSSSSPCRLHDALVAFGRGCKKLAGAGTPVFLGRRSTVVSIFEQRQRAIAELEAAWSENDAGGASAGTTRRPTFVRLRGRWPSTTPLQRRGRPALGPTAGPRTTSTPWGAMSGGQAVQMVRAGLQAIYVSGWQVAADANLSENVYPDQSLYRSAASRRWSGASTTPCSGRPDRVGRVHHLPRVDGAHRRRCEAGFGGPPQRLRAHEGDDRGRRRRVHFEDQLSSEKKCGHMGGKVLVRPPSTSGP